VARREYEHTFLELAQALDSTPETRTPEGLGGIRGLSFRSGREIVHNPDRPFIENLDELPWVSGVYQRHLDIRHYFNPNALFPMVTLMTSRGCPFRCRFCVYPQTLTGRRFRFRSIPDVVAEMCRVQDTVPGVKSIFLEDDTLSANRRRCLALADALIAARFRLPWTTNSRIDLDLTTLERMRKAGCRSLCVGFESGDQKVLETMGKGITREAMSSFMANAGKAGILVHGCFMVGFPGETREQIQKTIDLAVSLGPDTVQFYPVMVYPGTEAFRDYQERGWITAGSFAQWLTPEGHHTCMVRNETLSPEDLAGLCDEARRRFYLRPGYLLRKLRQILLNPSEAVRTLKAFKTFYRHLFRRPPR
jgi:radical SAM superfamily enzyme YgiQ (UPF0313 family)